MRAAYNIELFANYYYLDNEERGNRSPPVNMISSLHKFKKMKHRMPLYKKLHLVTPLNISHAQTRMMTEL